MTEPENFSNEQILKMILLDLVCDTIVRGHLSKKFGGLGSANIYVLVSDNKLDFYNTFFNINIVVER